VSEALAAGDSEALRTICLNLYLAGWQAFEICDRVVAPAFHAMGEQWYDGSLEIFQERRACEICLSVLRELQELIPPWRLNVPHAIGGTLDSDPYQLPTRMVSLTLRDAGLRAESYGTSLPASTLSAAVESVRPRVFWLSVSSIGDRQSFLEAVRMLYETCLGSRAALVVGGRALVPDIRREMNYTTYCESLSDLVAFVATVFPGVAPNDRAVSRRPEAPTSTT
jgi:methanogenic corrinoid protein MtbC1